MAFTFSETWDGVTAPALPTGWNYDAPFVTSTTNAYSSPNGLKVGTVTAGVVYYATYATADPGGGQIIDATHLVYLDPSAGTGDYYAGPTFRCSSATMDNSTTSCYWVRLWFTITPGNVVVSLSKVVNGVVTDLAAAYSGAATLPNGQWYSVRVTCATPDLFSVIVTRLSDGYTMNTNGDFLPGSNYAIQDFSAPDVASGAYNGLAAASADDGRIYFDDLDVSNTVPPPVFPRKPVIARVPFQFYLLD